VREKILYIKLLSLIEYALSPSTIKSSLNISPILTPFQELREIFANVPAPGTTAPPKSTQKPLDEDDCPICYSEFEANQSIVFCRAMCGTNIHNDCFRQWAATKNHGDVTCVMCRTKWVYEESVPGVDLVVDVEGATRGSEGFINVGAQLGLDERRGMFFFSPGLLHEL